MPAGNSTQPSCVNQIFAGTSLVREFLEEFKDLEPLIAWANVYGLQARTRWLQRTPGTEHQPPAWISRQWDMRVATAMVSVSPQANRAHGMRVSSKAKCVQVL